MADNVYLGIDLGIGSCGWALTTDTTLIALGSRTFDVPEDEKHTPTNQLRRIARGSRRVTARRRQRMNAVRALLHRHGLLDSAKKQSLAGTKQIDPWQARAEGLDRKLSVRELAVALGHRSRPTEWCSSVCLGMMAQGA
jgi:CRISPR-associated endonuclease Csn1